MESRDINKIANFRETKVTLRTGEVVQGWITDWFLTIPEENKETHVRGSAHCYNKAAPGEMFTTSVVLELDRENMLVRTKNSVYALGVEIEYSW